MGRGCLFPPVLGRRRRTAYLNEPPRKPRNTGPPALAGASDRGEYAAPCIFSDVVDSDFLASPILREIEKRFNSCGIEPVGFHPVDT